MTPNVNYDQCWTSGKNMYDKKTAITMVNHREKNFGRLLRAYHCPFCNYWHLTHKL